MDQFLSACLPGPPYKTENEPHFNTLVYFTMFPCHVLSCHYERFDNLNMMYIYLTIIGHTIHFSVRSIGASCWSCPSCLATFPPLRTCFSLLDISLRKKSFHFEKLPFWITWIPLNVCTEGMRFVSLQQQVLCGFWLLLQLPSKSHHHTRYCWLNA